MLCHHFHVRLRALCGYSEREGMRYALTTHCSALCRPLGGLTTAVQYSTLLSPFLSLDMYMCVIWLETVGLLFLTVLYVCRM